ncbi:Ig-like domain-containing protein [Ewingella americana]
MAQNGNVIVDVLSRINGSVVSQVSGASQTVNLNQLSIVRVHATRAAVTRYERVGNDLIVHMQDGSVVRYHSFFNTDGKGHHSELVFDDGVHPIEHATFVDTGLAPGSAVAVVPGYETIPNVGALVLDGTHFDPATLGWVLGAIALGAGVAIAASGGGGGGGGSSSNGGSDGGNTGGNTGGSPGGTLQAPTLTLATFAGDNVLNMSEVGSAQVFSGTTTHVTAGQTVTLTLNGKTYTTTTAADGSWSITLPAGDLQALADGTYIASASVTGTDGLTVTKGVTVGVDTTPPTLTVNPIDGDNIIDAQEHNQPLNISGTASVSEAGRTVTVTLNNTEYSATVNADGTWSVTIAANVVSALGNGQYTLTTSLTDAAGNTGSSTPVQVTVNDNAGQITVNAVADDGTLNAVEAASTLTISGSTTGFTAGTTITVLLNGETYTGTTAANGVWSIGIPASALAALQDGTATLTLSATDALGEPITQTATFNVVIHNLPDATLNPPFGDGILNVAEAGQPQILTGTTGVSGAGQTVVITLNGQQYTGTVDTSGNYSVTIPSAALTVLPEGTTPISVTVTDAAGNTNTLNSSATVDMTPPTLTINPLTGDGQINLAEAALAQTLTGTATASDAGKTVNITVNGHSFTAVVQDNGTWSASLPAGTLSGLTGNYPITATLTDAAGNTGTVTLDQHFATDPTVQPTLTLNAFAGDNLVDGAELAVSQVLSGSATNVEAGQIITLTLNGKTYTAEVGASGSWSVIVPVADVALLANGQGTLTATVTDRAGNTGTASETYTVNNGQDGVAIDPVTADNKISLAESEAGITISGTTLGVNTGTPVLITFGGHTYSALVLANGRWSVNLTPADLLNLAEGSQAVSVSTTDSLGNPLTNSLDVGVFTSLPVPLLNTPFGDNVLNIAEAAVAQTLSGTTSVSGDGQSVLVTLNGKNYAATVDATGNWSVTVPAADLQALPAGNNAVNVTATDSVGNSSTISPTVSVDLTAPTLTVNPISGDGLISVAEAHADIAVTGTASISEAGRTVTLTLNNVSYTGTVLGNGNWSITIPADALTGHANGTLPVQVSLSDAAGNTTTDNTRVTLATDPAVQPVVTLNAFAGDNILDGAERQAPQVLSGSTANVEAGQLVSINLNGHLYTAVVQDSGAWSVSVPAADLLTLTDGTQTISVNVTDKAGNVGTATENFTVNVELGGLGIDTIAGDNRINATEAGAPVVVSGTSFDVAAGATVIVTLNGKTYNATVGPDGTWSTNIPAVDLALLTDGPNTITAQAVDASGNPLSNSVSVGVYTHDLPDPTINTPFGDGLLGTAEAAAAQTLSGTTGTTGDGQTVVVTINGHDYTATVGDNGFWTVQVPSADLQTLPPGANPILVTATDAAGNTDTLTSNVTVDFTPPTLTINTIATDGIINAAEAAAAIPVSGTADIGDAGRTVTLNINGQTYTAVVAGDGSWSTSVPANALAGLANGEYTVTATLSDAAGNTTTITSNVTLTADPLLLPTITLNAFAVDNILDGAERTVDQTLSGTTTHVESGQIVTITIGAESYSATVLASGAWSATIPTAVLQALADGTATFNVSVSDVAGNPTTGSESFTVNSTLSGIAINPISGDGNVSATEAAAGITISGTTADVAAGTAVVVTLNGQNYNATVAADGTWTTTVPSAALNALTDGPNLVSVSTTDEAGVTITNTGDLGVYIHDLPAPTLNTPFTDGLLGNTEATTAQSLSGTTGVSGNGQTVTVSLGGHDYTATVDISGNWTVSIPSADLQALPAGPDAISVVATDAAGNSATIPGTVTVDFTPPTLTVAPVATDGTVNVSENADGFALTGTASVSEAGRTVNISFGGQNYQAVVAGDGTWSVPVLAGTLDSVASGQYVLTATLSDAAGNTTTFTENYTVAGADTAPVPSINTPFGDTFLNIAEAAGPQILSGTTGEMGDGQTVVVSLGGVSYNATVDVNGIWSLSVPGAALQVLDEGAQTITVTATDSVGNVGTVNSVVTVDLVAPTLTISPVATDDIINAAEALQPVVISGTASLSDAGQTVTVSFNSVNYTALVHADGTWSFTLPSNVVQGLANDTYLLSASITDAAGNTTTQQHSFSVDANAASLPTLSIGVMSGDDYINATEKGEPLVISGTSTHLEAGQVVTVVFNGNNYTTNIVGDGTWTLTVQPGDFANLSDGQTTITASSSDLAGNPASATHNVDVIADPADLPSITISPISGDDVINSTEHSQPLVISGTSNHLVAGETITVNLNNIGYPTTVAADGTWTVTVPASAVEALQNQSYTVTATGNDVADNVATGTHTLTVDTTPPLLTITVDTGVDNILNAAEALAGLPVSGTGEAGLTVTVTLNNVNYTTVVLGDGTWSLTVPAGDLQAIPTDGLLPITATATDAAGNNVIVSVAPEISLAIHALPTLTLDAITGDNILNIAESAANFTITGTSTNLPDGTVVAVNIGGTIVNGTVTGGIWSAPVSANLLNGLTEGVNTVTVSVTDANGNPASTSHSLTVDLIAPPVPVINTPFVDGALNQLEAGVNQIITGSTGLTGPGQTVVVSVDGNPAHNVTATVGPDGSWTATLPTATLAGLPDGPNTVSVTVTDAGGNSTSGTLAFTALIHALPVVTVTDSFDGLINANEAAAGGLLSGVTGITSLGQSVIVNINGQNYTANVIDTAGTWSLDLLPSLLQTLPNGNWTVTVTATDSVGNTSSANEILDVQLTPPPIPTIGLPFGDGILNNAEAAAGQILTGSTGVTGAGQTVSVAFAGVVTPFTATVAADGTWTLNLSPLQLADLGGLPSHTITVTSTNEFGNSSSSAPLPFDVDFATPTPAINALFGGDNILNIAEAGAAQTITGITGIQGDNQNVKLSIDLNGVQYNATVAADGSWSLTLPAGTLSTLTGIPHSVNVTVTDASGNTASTALPFTTDFTPPVVAVTSVFVDGYLNATEAQSNAGITGTTDGTAVHVTIGGVPFDATVLDGVWTLNLTPAQLATLPQGDQTMVVTATDVSGNTSNISTQVGIANTLLPTVSVATFAGDNALDYAESRVPQVLSGTTTHVQQGETVNITIPGVTGPLTALVQADGSWSLTLTPAQLQGLGNGTENVTISVNDLAGNTATGGTSFTVDLTAPVNPFLTLNPISTDNIINVGDNLNLTLAVGGEYRNAAVIQTVNVFVDGVVVGTAPIVLAGDGTWSLAVPLVSLTTFPLDGTYTVSAELVSILPVPGTVVATVSETVVVDRTPPTLTINTFAGNDVLNSTEAAAGQIVSGTASTTEAGRTVTVTLNSKTYTAVVAGDGTWSTTIAAGDLQAVPQGSNTLTANISDAAGNVTTDTHTFTTDTSAPLLNLNVVAGDNVINLAESLLGTLLSGTSSGADGQTVTVTLAGVTVGTAVIQSGGAWSLQLLPNQLSGLLDGPTILNATVADQAGNTTSVDLGLNILFNSLLNVSVVSGLGSVGNTVLNAAGALLGQTLSGVTTDAGVGAVVSVQVGGQTVSANVGANGAWSLVIPPTLLANLADGPLALNLTVTDAAGNSKVDVLNLDIAKTVPVIGALTSALGGVDSILNVAESAAAQTVSGAVTAANGTVVTLAVGAQTFTGTVLNNLYSINVPAGALTTLADGVVPVVLTLTDAAGNTVSQTLNPLTVALHNLPQIILDPLFGDGLLNAADLLLNQTITGTVKNVAAGTTVLVTLGNGSPPLNALVDASGHFSVTVPASSLAGLLTGTLGIDVSVTDVTGNSANTSALVAVNVALPTISLSSILDHGVLNAVDALTAQTISGVVGGVAAGTTVNVTIGGKTFLGVTDAGGNFSVTLQPGDLKALTDGTLAIGVSVANDAGNVASISANANVIINQLPKVVLDTVFGGDGILNAAEALLTQTISGTVTNAAAGSSVNITVGTLNLTATVDGSGHFSASLLPAQLSQLLNGNISVSATVTDAVGNASSASAGILVGIHNLPSIVLNPIFGDGVLNVVDLLTGQTISGIATNVAQGTQVQVSLNGKNYSATVGIGGAFSVTVPPLDLGAILNGTINVAASVVDATGNPASATGLLSVIAQSLPTISLNPLFGDGLLNAADALLTQTISGTTTNAVGSTVTLTVGGATLNALVKADGTFSVSVLPAVLSGLLDGTLNVGASVTNAAGHSTTGSATATVGIHTLPSLVLGTLFGGDGYLNLSEASSNETLSGTTNVQTGTVSVNVGGIVHTGTVTGGVWNVVYTSAELKGITDGTTTVNVTVTDAVGNTTMQTSPLIIKTHELPLVALNPLLNVTLGLVLNILGGQGLTLSGTSRNVGQNGQISVTLAGNTLSGTVQADGSWTVKFSSALLSSIGALNLLGILTSVLTVIDIHAADAAGNTVDAHIGLTAGSTLPADTSVVAASLSVDDTHTLAAVHITDTSSSTTDTTTHTTSTLTDPLVTTDTSSSASNTTTTPVETTSHAEAAFSIGGVTIELTATDGVAVGGAGNDTISVHTLDFSQVDGGTGVDTLLLAGTNQHLDLTLLGLKVEHIDIFDLGTSGTNSISLNLHEALTVKDNPTDEVIIKGGTGSLVNLVAGNDGAWSETGQRTVDGLTFDVYHNASLSDTNTLGDVLVQHGLHVQQN